LAEERFTAADDKHIVGAGSTYALAETGGANLSVNTSTNSAGAHTGTTYDPGVRNTEVYGGLPGPSAVKTWSAGEHNHTISGDFEADYQKVILIKALEVHPKAPIHGAFLSGSTLSLTNIFTDNRLLKSGNSVISGGGDTFVTSSSGIHTHGFDIRTYRLTDGMGWYYFMGDAGAHTHSVTPSLTPNMKRKILSAWTNASSEFNAETNMIAMWESATPPDGWDMCNGSNGTVDLRDYFIEMGAGGDENVVGLGDNTISGTIPADSSSWTHAHNTMHVMYWTGNRPIQHASESHTHEHSVTISSESYTPPYYALYFVQKL